MELEADDTNTVAVVSSLANMVKDHTPEERKGFLNHLRRKVNHVEYREILVWLKALDENYTEAIDIMILKELERKGQ